jgi:hypothetical protein
MITSHYLLHLTLLMSGQFCMQFVEALAIVDAITAAEQAVVPTPDASVLTDLANYREGISILKTLAGAVHAQLKNGYRPMTKLIFQWAGAQYGACKHSLDGPLPSVQDAILDMFPVGVSVANMVVTETCTDVTMRGAIDRAGILIASLTWLQAEREDAIKQHLAE